MLLLAGIIAFGNLLACIAPGFWTFMLARLISGLPHGAYFGVGAIVARKLAAPGKEVSAVAMMIAGMTVATLVGVPAGTFITNNMSWRMAFMIVALCGVVTLLAINRWVPQVPGLEDRGFKGSSAFSAHCHPG